MKEILKKNMTNNDIQASQVQKKEGHDKEIN